MIVGLIATGRHSSSDTASTSCLLAPYRAFSPPTVGASNQASWFPTVGTRREPGLLVGTDVPPLITPPPLLVGTDVLPLLSRPPPRSHGALSRCAHGRSRSLRAGRRPPRYRGGSGGAPPRCPRCCRGKGPPGAHPSNRGGDFRRGGIEAEGQAGCVGRYRRGGLWPGLVRRPPCGRGGSDGGRRLGCLEAGLTVDTQGGRGDRCGGEEGDMGV